MWLVSQLWYPWVGSLIPLLMFISWPTILKAICVVFGDCTLESIVTSYDGWAYCLIRKSVKGTRWHHLLGMTSWSNLWSLINFSLHDGPHITLPSNYMTVSFQRKRLRLKNLDNLQMFVRIFTIHNLSAPHKWRIVESKDNYAHVIHGPMGRTWSVDIILFRFQCLLRQPQHPRNVCVKWGWTMHAHEIQEPL